MTAPFASDKLQRFDKLSREYFRRVAKHAQSQRGWYDDDGVRQGGLIAFVRYFWHILEPETPFVDGWPLWAMCEHLEAVTFGEITRLLMNVPPGFMKSMLTDVFWPAWEWGPMKKAHLRYVAFSYSASLTERDNDRFRTLIASEPYQRMYGPVRTSVEMGERVNEVGLRNKTIIKVQNTKMGWKLASSVGGVGTGERGDRIILDDPHNVLEGESEQVRGETVRWFRESMSDRLNNMQTGAIVIIMQRVHEEDVSGTVLSLGLPYCHLMIPMEYDPERQEDAEGDAIETQIGWFDPRDKLDEPAWDDRFSAQVRKDLEAVKGEFAWASQYQQSPMPRGGGIFKREWWQLWDATDGKFPEFDLIIASLDGAFTEKEENDPSALTLWGIFLEPETKQKRIMLVHAWRKHLQFSTARIEPLQFNSVIDGRKYPAEVILPGMSQSEVNMRRAAYRRRTSGKWGLIEWVEDTCIRFKVDKLLIEAKASGISAAQEISNRYGNQEFSIQLCPVKGDKVARAYAVQPTFSQGMIFAPDRDWAEEVIAEMEIFPKGKHDDLTDSTTQALKYLREVGLAMTDTEVQVAERERVMHRPKQKALYPV